MPHRMAKWTFVALDGSRTSEDINSIRWTFSRGTGKAGSEFWHRSQKAIGPSVQAPGRIKDMAIKAARMFPLRRLARMGGVGLFASSLQSSEEIVARPAAAPLPRR